MLAPVSGGGEVVDAEPDTPWVSVSQPPPLATANCELVDGELVDDVDIEVKGAVHAPPPRPPPPSVSPASPVGSTTTGVDTTDTSDSYLLHKVNRLIDTIPGICLRYKINARELRKVNKFSGESLILAPDYLKIPNSAVPNRGKASTSLGGLSDEEVKQIEMMNSVEKFVNVFPNLTRLEAKFYLEDEGWDFDKAVSTAKADVEWENGSDVRQSITLADVLPPQPKTLKVVKPMPNSPPFSPDIKGMEMNKLKMKGAAVIDSSVLERGT